MLMGLIFRALREPSAKAFRDLPLPRTPLPAEVAAIRFSLMRALQGVREFALYQFGREATFRRYMVGPWPVQPVIGEVLVRHGWVTAGAQPWAEAVVQFRLSSAGMALAEDLESWWANLTFGQRLRAVLAE